MPEMYNVSYITPCMNAICSWSTQPLAQSQIREPWVFLFGGLGGGGSHICTALIGYYGVASSCFQITSLFVETIALCTCLANSLAQSFARKATIEIHSHKCM